MSEIKWNDPKHQCYGCKWVEWSPECGACRRLGNLQFATSTENPDSMSLPDRYVPEMPYGTQKILPRSVATGIKPKE